MEYSTTLPWLVSPDGLQGGRLRLPAKELAALSRHIAPGAPLLLAVTGANGRRAFAGVRDFEAPEGFCELPLALLTQLGLEPGAPGGAPPTVALALCPPLAAAEALALAPLQASFFDEVADPEAWLSTQLPRSYLALALGDTITLQHCGRALSFAVADAQPRTTEGAVSLFNTNVALELRGGGSSVPVLAPGGRLSVEVQPGGSVRVRLAAAGAAPLLACTAAVCAPEADGGMSDAGGGGSAAAAAAAAGDGTACLAGVYVTPGAGASPTWPSLALHTWAAFSCARGVALTAAGRTQWPGEEAEAGEAAAAAAALQGPYLATVVHHGSGGAPLRVTLTLTPEGSGDFAGAGGGRTSSSGGAAELPALLLFAPRQVAGGGSSGLPPLAPPPAAAAPPGAPPAPPPQPCPHCRAAIPARTYDLHAATCARQNVVCAAPGCGRVLKRGSAEAAAHAHCSECGEVGPPALAGAHAALRHGGGGGSSGSSGGGGARAHACPHAGCGHAAATLEAARAHARAACPARPLRCRFCGEHVLSGGASAAGSVDGFLGLCAHEGACGSRSTRCSDCGRGVLLKLWGAHRLEAHGEEGGGGGVAAAAAAAAALPLPLRLRAGSGDSTGSESLGRVAAEEGGGARVMDEGSSSRGAGGALQLAGAQQQQQQLQQLLQSLPLHQPPPQLCANSCCSYRAAGAGMGALCERCSPLLAPLARDKGALLALYRRQAAGGCASAACKNPACRLADGGDAGALEALLAHLCSITTYFVCVADHARLAVPPLPPQLARPRRASAGSGEAQGAPLAASSSAAARRSKRSVASAFF